jgi:ubiquinone/menaquinone biosynthesis C-methylase UbiE
MTRPSRPKPPLVRRGRGTRGSLPVHVRKNIALWQRQSNSYDRKFRGVLGGRRAMAWGLWRVPESRLSALGDPDGRDILELGCGAARWSAALAQKGARAVGVDLSSAQLAHAARLLRRSGPTVRLVRGNAEELPFRDQCFDIVFCDWGAMTFCDPFSTVPEAARVLRPGGRFVFATASPFRTVAESRQSYRMGRRLRYDYFGMHRIEYAREVNFSLPYGAWIRLFTEQGFVIESLTETQPRRQDVSRYLSQNESEWARHWPLELIWQVRKSGGPIRRTLPRNGGTSPRSRLGH